MDWNKHSALEGQHAFLSASKYHWRNWTIDKLDRALTTYQAAAKGTRLHSLAHMCIMEREYLGGPGQEHTTTSLYVMHAIDFDMVSEQMLVVSRNCFGTADTIGFKLNPETNRMKLRIHDLKTGVIKASPKQLECYAAYFCIEYGVDPFDIEFELRIYQNSDVYIYDTDPAIIRDVMNVILQFDEYIETKRARERGEA